MRCSISHIVSVNTFFGTRVVRTQVPGTCKIAPKRFDERKEDYDLTNSDQYDSVIGRNVQSKRSIAIYQKLYMLRL